MSKSKNKDLKESPNTNDASREEGDVPSVTKLLNRKKLLESDIYSESEEAQEELDENSDRTLTHIVVDSGVKRPRIQKAKLRMVQSRSKTEYFHLPLDKLSQSELPLGHVLNQLINHTVHSALFLEYIPTQESPLFMARFAIGRVDLINLWDGLVWNPTLTPQFWNQLVQKEIIQLDESKEIRQIFGITLNDFISFCCVGSKDHCLGLLVVISKNPVLKILEDSKSILDTVDLKQLIES